MPWQLIDRLCLEAGFFPPRYRPLSERELADLLERVSASLARRERSGAAAAELEAARRWRDHYFAGGPALWRGCSCSEDPPALRAGGGLRVGATGLGDRIPGEAGLAWAAGSVLTADLRLDLATERWWLGASGRFGGRVARTGRVLADDDPLAWPHWPLPTGRPRVGAARKRGGAWAAEVPRLVAGVRWGSWSFALGQAQRCVGPGLDGGFTMSADGRSFVAGTVRRSRPMAWPGLLARLAPEDLLLRCGRLSVQDVIHRHGADRNVVRQHPWFFQWLVGWRPLPWFRFTATHAAMAAREGDDLWGDVLRVNFPLSGTALQERSSGLATDRLFSMQMEVRWRDAPWPLLPAAGGRLYWEYAGTDVLTGDPAGLPRVASPASVVGVALVESSWDVAAEYAGLHHDLVLWYSNSSFGEGFTHEGWLPGHPLGGSGKAAVARIRVRTAGREAGLQLARRRWGMAGRTPGTGREWSVVATLGRTPLPDTWRWTAHLEWRREEAAPPGVAPVERDWWRGWLACDLP